MPARTIKTRMAFVVAAAAVSFGSAATVAASVGLAAAPASASVQQVRLPHVAPTMHDDPHGSFATGDQHVVLCATAIEYGLIA